MIAFDVRLGYIGLGRVIQGDDDAVVEEQLFRFMEIGHALAFIVAGFGLGDESIVGRVVILGVIFVVGKDVHEARAS